MDKDLDKNELVVVQGDSHLALYSKSLEAMEMNWVEGMPPAEKSKCTAKFRYRQSDQGVKVQLTGDRIFVEFDKLGKSSDARTGSCILSGEYLPWRRNHRLCGKNLIKILKTLRAS